MKINKKIKWLTAGAGLLLLTSATAIPTLVSCSSNDNGNTSTNPSNPDGGNNNPSQNLNDYKWSKIVSFVEENTLPKNNENIVTDSNLSFKQERFDINKISKSSRIIDRDISRFYNSIFNSETFGNNLSSFFYENGNQLLNNFNKETTCINLKDVEFIIDENVNPKEPEVTIRISIGNNKKISATFYGFNDASLEKNYNVLLSIITTYFSYVFGYNLYYNCNSYNEAISTKNLDYFKFYKEICLRYVNLIGIPIKINKPFSEINNLDIKNAISKFLNENIDNFLKNILGIIKKAKFLYSKESYRVNANFYGTIILTPKEKELLTPELFEFGLTQSLNYQGANEMGIKYKNSKEVVSDARFVFLIADNQYQEITDEQYLSYLEEAIKKNVLNTNLELPKELMNDLPKINFSYEININRFLLQNKLIPPNLSTLKVSFDLNNNLIISLNNKTITLKNTYYNIKWKETVSTDKLMNNLSNYFNSKYDLKNKTITLKKSDLNDTTINIKTIMQKINAEINGFKKDFDDIQTNISDNYFFKYKYKTTFSYINNEQRTITYENVIRDAFISQIHYDSKKQKVFFYCVKEDLANETSLGYLDINVKII